MKDKYAPRFGFHMLTLFACTACGILTCGLDLSDHCMDNAIFQSLESDGLTVFGTNSEMQTQIGLSKLCGLDIKNNPTVSINYDSSAGAQKITYGNISRTIPTGESSSSIWSRKDQTLYFIVHTPSPLINRKNSGTPGRSTFCSWSAKQGFKAIYPVNDPNLRLSQSLDEGSITLSPQKWNGKGNGSIDLYSLRDGSHRAVPCPSWAIQAVLLRSNRFLLWRHDSGNIGQVYIWTPGQMTPPKELNIGGPITDAIALNGQLWALQKRSEDVRIVRIRPDLQKVEEAFPWPETTTEPTFK